jgi:GT2 family glycosyltransferase
MDISIVIANWNGREYLERCLRSITDTVAGCSYEIIVVDNGSTDGSAAMVSALFPGVKLIANVCNEGYTRGVNTGIRVSSGAYVLVLNNDIVLMPGAVAGMLSILREMPGVSLVSCRLLNPDGSVQRFCRTLPTAGVGVVQNTFLERIGPGRRCLDRYYMAGWLHDDSRPVEQPPGCAWLVRRSAFESVGLLDERFFLFYSDVDFCERLKAAGAGIYFAAQYTMTHYHAVATRELARSGEDMSVLWYRDRNKYFLKHYGILLVAVIKAVQTVDFMARIAVIAVSVAGKKERVSALGRNIFAFARILAC